MKAPRRSPLALLIAAALAAGAADATALAAAPAAPEAAASAPQVLPTVIVQGLSYGHGTLPSAASVLGRRALTEGQPQINLSETLNQVPGLIVNNRQDYAQDMQMSIRGFGADSPFGVQDLRLVLDGIPLTMPDGQAQSQVIDMPMLGGVKVIKGPFVALYGNAAGGVLEAWTRPAPHRPEATLSTWLGAWGTRQTVLSGGARSGAWSGVAGLTDMRTAGWRQHSQATRRQFNAVLRRDDGGSDRYSVVVNALNQNAQDPAGLTRAELQRDPSGVDPAIVAYDARKTARNRQVGVSWHHRFDASNAMQFAVYDGTRRVVQFLPFSGDFGVSAGGVVDLRDAFGGARAQYTHAGELAARAYRLDAGIDYGRENEWRKGWINDFGTQTGLRNDQYNTVDNFAQFVQAHWQLGSRVELSGGVRHDQVRFGSTTASDSPFGAGSGGGASYASTDPVLGVSWRVGPNDSVYADYGHGFVTPTAYQLAYRPDGKPGLNFALQPMHLRSAEVGWRGSAGVLRVDAALYHVDTDNQIVVYKSIGGRTTYINAGSTRRWGVDLGVHANLPADLHARLAYSLVDVRFVGGPYDGNTMPGVPRQQLDSILSWRPRGVPGFHAALDWQLRSQVYVDAQNSAAAQGWGVLNASLGTRQHTGRWTLHEYMRVDNVLDRNYVGAVVIADSQGRYYEAAPGRNFGVGVELTRGF